MWNQRGGHHLVPVDTYRPLRWSGAITAIIVLWLFGTPARLPAVSPQETDDAPIAAAAAFHIEPLVPGTTRQWEAMARAITGLAPGTPITADRMHQAIEALRRTRAFSRIHADTRTGLQGETVVFDLAVARRIKDIHIQGGAPLFERDVQRAMNLAVGDIFDGGQMDQQAERIVTRYRQAGCIRPQVKLSQRIDPGDGHVVVDVKIDAGPGYRLGQLVLKGNQDMSDARLRSRLHLWRYRHWPGSAGWVNEERLAADSQRLTAFYRRQGYAGAVVTADTATQRQTGTLDVIFHITEGPCYRVRFEGNRHVRQGALRGELVLFSQGDADGAGIRRSLDNIRDLYHRRGFLRAQVALAPETPAPPGAERQLVVTIDEGPRPRVTGVVLKGNRHMATAQLTALMATRPASLWTRGRFVQEILDQDLDAIRTAYLQEGYPAAEVRAHTDLDNQTDTLQVTVEIEEGQAKRVAALRLTGDDGLDLAATRSRLELKPGSPFRPYMVASDRNLLTAAVSEQGYPHVTVTPEIIDGPTAAEVGITFHVARGLPVTTGETFYVGNFDTAPLVLDRALDLARGQPFSTRRVLAGQRRLQDLGALNTVRLIPIGLKEGRDTVHMVAEVEEKKPYYVQGGLGYENQRGFFLEGRLGDRNLMGMNREVYLDAETSQTGQRAALGAADPQLAGWPISASGELFAEERTDFNQDFGTRSTGMMVGLSRRWTEKLRAELSTRYERRWRFTAAGGSPTDPEEYAPRTVVVATPALHYDDRDNFVRPRQGWLAAAGADVSHGLNNRLDDFVKYRGELRAYTSPLAPLTLAALARAGYIAPYNPLDRVPEDQLFFLGGTASVRGFQENLLRRDTAGDPLGGRLSLNASIEARLDLGGDIELTGFVDAGRLGKTDDAADDQRFRHAAGLGLRYQTPIGPVGLLYGFKLDRRPGEPAGRLHISIGYSF